MNQKIKKIIAATLVVSAFSAVVPVSNINLMTTKVYAASDDETLSSLKLKTSSGSNINIYSDNGYKNKDKVDSNKVKDGKTYYAKTSSNKIKISTSGPSSSNVRVFNGTSSSTKGVKTSGSISLSSGNNTIIVRVYSDDPGSVKYKENDDVVSEYKIRVKCTSSDDDDDNVEDNVYLKSISLSDGDIDFSKKTSTYDVKVSESVKDITITAKPDCDSDEYDDYEVKIDGTEVDESDKFRREVSLSKGKNTIKITVKDDDDNKRTYTLNITRGTSSSTNNDDNNSESATDKKTNQWINNNGVWQYNDSLGNPLKNTWFYDRTSGKNYYLQADGSMATGWLFNNGRWYYLNPISNGTRGAMQTGWQYINGSWYYLDGSGVMQTGWFRDWSGTAYYLNSNGSMKTGWLLDGGKWYYLNSNGAMQTTSKYIDGKLYNFYSNGAMK